MKSMITNSASHLELGIAVRLCPGHRLRLVRNCLGFRLGSSLGRLPLLLLVVPLLLGIALGAALSALPCLGLGPPCAPCLGRGPMGRKHLASAAQRRAAVIIACGAACLERGPAPPQRPDHALPQVLVDRRPLRRARFNHDGVVANMVSVVVQVAHVRKGSIMSRVERGNVSDAFGVDHGVDCVVVGCGSLRERLRMRREGDGDSKVAGGVEEKGQQGHG